LVFSNISEIKGKFNQVGRINERKSFYQVRFAFFGAWGSLWLMILPRLDLSCRNELACDPGLFMSPHINIIIICNLQMQTARVQL
jgi:hypothetical protein